MDIHRPVVPGVGIAPHHVHQILPAVHPPGIAHQQLDQIVLLGGQIHGLSIPDGHPLLRVQGQVPRGQDGAPVPLRAGGPPQQRPNPGLQLQNVEGFCNIVIRSALKAHQLVRVLALGGEHDDGHIGELPDPHTCLLPVQLRHHHIQNDEIEAAVAGQLHGGGTVIGTLHLVPLVLQIEFHAFDQQLFVINHQNPHLSPLLCRCPQ